MTIMNPAGRKRLLARFSRKFDFWIAEIHLNRACSTLQFMNRRVIEKFSAITCPPVQKGSRCGGQFSALGRDCVGPLMQLMPPLRK
jgi:hypothetical protein